MTALIVLTLTLTVLLVPTKTADTFQQCCPEDEEHIFLKRDKICNASRTLGLMCKDENEVNLLLQSDSYFWFIEEGGSVVLTSKALDVVLLYDSFCAATIVDETQTESNETIWQVEEGIIYCKEAQSYATYTGPEPLSYTACILISGIGCFLTFFTYVLVPGLRRDLLSKCLVNALCSLTVMYLTQGITTFGAHKLPQWFCSYQSLLTFFWTTASIFWTYVISFDIWRSVIFTHLPSNESHLLKVYYFWGWVVPVILSLTGLTTHDPRAIGISDDCRINPVYMFALYAQSAIVLLFFALMYFTWALCKLWKQDTPNTPDKIAAGLTTVHYKCYLHWKLFLLMSIPWMMCVMAAYLPENSFTRITVNIMAALQGVLTFLLLVILRKKALLGIADKLADCRLHLPFFIMNLATKLCDEDENSQVVSDEVEQMIIKVDTQEIMPPFATSEKIIS